MWFQGGVLVDGGEGGARAERAEEQRSGLKRGEMGVLLGGGEGGGSDELRRAGDGTSVAEAGL